MPTGASKQKHSTRASCRTWLLACGTFAILGVQQIKMFVTLPQTSRQSEPMDSRRRALILGGMSFAAFEDQAHAASSAAAKIKECQAEANKIVGGLESTAKNALAMTPGQPGLLNSKLVAHPNWAALSRARRPRFVLLQTAWLHHPQLASPDMNSSACRMLQSGSWRPARQLSKQTPTN
ncbi:unnamed protein product, partial [Symbiodinium sp. CCMP2456]